MTAWQVPPPARSGPAAAGSLGAQRWACGIAASYQEWPQAEYTFRPPDDIGLPVYVGHQETRIVTSGFADGSVGAARRFAEVPGLGVVVLLEIAGLSVLRDIAEGKRCGLSVTAYVDPPPGGGPAWVYFSEISLTEHPRDPLARVVSSGALALSDWASLTAPAGRAVC
jgi:hypothetical protein